MNKTFYKLNEKDAQAYYLKMTDIFQKFINNDPDVFNYGINFDWNNVEYMHELANLERNREMEQHTEWAIREKMIDILSRILLYQNLLKDGKYRLANCISLPSSEETTEAFNPDAYFESISDYYFQYNNRYYTLDISHNFENYGMNNSYIYHTYPGQYDDLYYCQLSEYHHDLMEYDERKISISFIYNKKTKKIVEILDIVRYSLPQENSQIIREISGESYEEFKTLKRIQEKTSN